MRKSKVLLLVPLMLLFCVGVAQAAFDNSHHDMTSYSTSTQSCFHCHGRSATINTASLSAELGAVGGLCLGRCHQNSASGLITGPGVLPNAGALVDADGAYTTIPTTDVANASYTVVYFTNSHDRLKSALKDRTGAAVNLTAGGAATWPYVSASDCTVIQCTSCHAVHDSANAPFLWAPLAASSATTFDGFCDKCHTERATNNLSASADGNHPVDFVVNSAVAATRTGGTPVRHGRNIVIQGYTGARIFDVAGPAAAAMTGNANPWQMGGHLTSGVNAAMVNWTGAGSTQQMGCYTCHAAHRTSVKGENNLTVIANANDNATGGFNPICVGCHGANTTWAADSTEFAVGTSAWGHPVGANTRTSGSPALYTSSVGGIRFAVATPVWNDGPAANDEFNQYGAAGQILCSSCHKVHFGNTASMSLVDIAQGTKSICKSCHTGVGIPNVGDVSKGGAASATNANAANSHHVTHAGAVTNGMGKVGDTNTTLTIDPPSWANATTGLGDLSGGMDCADCHLFNGTAHNW